MELVEERPETTGNNREVDPRGQDGARSGAPGGSQASAWSGLAVAASLALVAFAILFGIYGPPLGDRGNPSLGTPLFELADMTRTMHDEMVFEAIHAMGRETPATDGTGPADSGPAMEEVAAATERILGKGVALPDLSSFGFRPMAPRATRLPGMSPGDSAAHLAYVRGPAGSREFVTLTLIPDDEQFIVYDEFGRPRFVPINRPMSIDISSDGFGQRLALVWTDGSIVHVAHASRSEILDEIYDTLTLPMTRSAVTDNSADEEMTDETGAESGSPAP